MLSSIYHIHHIHNMHRYQNTSGQTSSNVNFLLDKLDTKMRQLSRGDDRIYTMHTELDQIEIEIENLQKRHRLVSDKMRQTKYENEELYFQVRSFKSTIKAIESEHRENIPPEVKTIAMVIDTDGAQLKNSDGTCSYYCAKVCVFFFNFILYLQTSERLRLCRHKNLRNRRRTRPTIYIL